MPTTIQTRRRERISAGLLYLAWALTAFATVTQFLVLIAGTWLADAGSVQRVGLSSLSIVSFDGIVADSESPNKYLVKMHFFLNAFGWEYPSAAEKSHTAGIVYAEAGRSLYLPRDLIRIGEQLNLDPLSWDCFSPNWDTCTSDYYQVFYRGFPFDYSITLSLIVYCYSAFVVLYALFVEVLIVYRPHWLRCRCCMFRRWCPCPKGTKEEIEKLPQVFWDRFRLWVYPLVAAAAVLAVVNLMLRGLLLISYLGYRDSRLGGGMNAQLGTGFLNISWIGVAAGQVAWMCILIRFLISRRATWIEQQSAMAAGRAIEGLDVDLEDAETGEPRVQKVYTDEPEAGAVAKTPLQT